MQGLPVGPFAPVIDRAAALVVALAVCAPVAIYGLERNQRQAPTDEGLQREAEALVRMADAAAAGRDTRSDFLLTWHNDFFKARPGTFVPFTILFDRTALAARSALLYVRVQKLPAEPRRRSGGRGPYPFETIFPVRLGDERGSTGSIQRGFAVAPGRYLVVVVLRELAGDGGPGNGHSNRRGAALTLELDVPNFWTGELTTSTVVLAERLEQLDQPIPAAELDEDPYVVGSTRIHPARTTVYNRNQELIVIFLVYNPSVGLDKHFDVQVDYHLYRKDQAAAGARPGADGDRPAAGSRELYVTRTSPQRFNPAMMGPRFDPSDGAPVMAGQGILLASFEPGEYRLGITVTDLLSRKAISRDVMFTLIGS